MSFKTKVAKHVIKNVFGSGSVSDQPSQRNQNTPAETTNDTISSRNDTQLTMPSGKVKKNKWNIPPNLTKQEAKVLTKVKKRAHILDNGFCFCCCFRIGLDPLIGLIPVIGDFLGVFFALSLVKKAKEANLPSNVVAQMLFNVFIDWLLGLTPFIGDFFDFLYKANTRNAIILEEYLVDRAKNRSVVMEDGSVEVIRA
ncbi:5605_t:CDS:2 [Acaulospora morrowiae]|uniref:5605_t:CDS:1 n=1 Tax=Acaulospora morrowiae TaxID=94023 RepID=A0A9N9CWD2_9GLOM|nr:5605_t:CDS:2 [Acaulospora morrowiae]